ncbi:MAG: clostripain-related cysteine peptidase [Desulfobacterota bacterium]|nr:clostripain-related cysteine peptidase [Thermodesulfobacteriota bacterium]
MLMKNGDTYWPRHSLCLTCILFLFLAAAGCSGSSEKAAQARWTYMVYMAADNNLSDAGLGDVNEMELTGSSSAVNVVIQAEFSREYSSDAPANTLRGRLVRDADPARIASPLDDIGNRDMSDSSTLTEFIAWAADTYPAENYALVLWDHGDGWKAYPEDATPYKGALQDDTSSGTLMSLPDIASAIRLSGVHFSLINFDACYMGMYETVCELSGLADYMMFSEEATPSDGDPYNSILDGLARDPAMTGAGLARLTATEYLRYYRNQARSYASKSAIDMSMVGVLHTQLVELAGLISDGIGTDRTALQFARDNSLSCKNRPSYHDLMDILAMLSATASSGDIRAKAAQLEDTLSAAVLANEIYSSSPTDTILGLGGLSIYLPRRSQVTDDELSRYDLLACNRKEAQDDSSWGDLIALLISFDEGSGMDPLPTGEGGFTIWLEWDTDADLDLLVWEPDGTLCAPYAGSSSANGFFSADSASTGISAEYFRAFDKVASGRYDILVNYYEDGSSQGAHASLYFMDPSLGIDELTLLEEFFLDLSHPAPDDWQNDDGEQSKVWNNGYSDWYWWYHEDLLLRSVPASVTVTIDGRSEQAPATKNPSPPENLQKTTARN